MTKSTTATLTLALTAVLGLAACGGSDSADKPTVTVGTPTTAPATTEADKSDAEKPTVTVAAPTTTEAPKPTAPPITEAPTTEAPTTTVPEPENFGVVWNSVVDPARVNAQGQPVFQDLGVTARVDMVLWVKADGRSELSHQCKEELEWDQEVNGLPIAEHCLIVQWNFDVAPDISAEDGSVMSGSMLTPDGLQIDSYASESGLPGAKGRGVVAMYAGGVPGSTLNFEISQGGPDYDSVEHSFVLPALEQMQPVNF